MVYGGVHRETLRLNEDSIWYGGPIERTPKDALAHLPRLRELIRRNKHHDAEALVRERFMATPQSARHYEPLGTWNLDFDYGAGFSDDAELFNTSPTSNQRISAHSNYQRTLNLDTACTVTEYTIGGVQIRREVFASNPDDVIAIHIVSSGPIGVRIHLTRMSDVDWETNEFVDSVKTEKDGDGGARIIMHATPGGRQSNSFCCVVGATTPDPEGSINVTGRDLVVYGSRISIALSARTIYRESNPELACRSDCEKALSLPLEDSKRRHIEDWKAIYDSMKLSISPLTGSQITRPTDERLKNNDLDPCLVSLYHNFGRYLLISCSRNHDKNPLPATLQGIWNPSFQPPWGSKYTININLQMNYWLAHTCNLSACELPLFGLLKRMADRGKRTAELMYGCRGWCCHHNTDIWADTDPQDRWMPATLWPLGGAWLCLHIWEYYAFTGDKDFLKDMLPVLEGCVEFLLDFLVEDAEGKYLVTNPSLSPENTFLHADGTRGILCEGSAIDIRLIDTVLRDYIRTLDELGLGEVQAILSSDAQAALSRLPPLQISPRTNTIQEWGHIDPDEAEPGHRHVSHLLGLYPGNSITPSGSPDLAAAAVESLRRRLSHGGGHTGWSRAWLIGLFARLRMPEAVEENVTALLRHSTLPNMLDTHPPFQIDGNFGATAGITEALVQSHEVDASPSDAANHATVIRLLPACPASWADGRIQGVKARGGFELSFEWKHGRVLDPVAVTSRLGNDAVIYFHDAGSSAQGEDEKAVRRVWVRGVAGGRDSEILVRRE